MRIQSGIYKGRKLQGSKDLSIRPTTSRVKESVFNILQDFCRGAQVADVFSGSGGLGLEALSRGADHVTFVEKSPSSIKTLLVNLAHLGVPDNHYSIVQKDAIDFAATSQLHLDLILMDPPFVYPPVQQLLNTVFAGELLKKNGLLVIEHETSNPIEELHTPYELLKQRKFGRSLISFLARKGDIQ